MESSKETGCRTPEGPILCINNCGFFGSTATMSMCSKCHKDMILKQQQAKLAASSIENIVNSASSSSKKGPEVLDDTMAKEPVSVKLKPMSPQLSADTMSFQNSETKTKLGQNRCNTCHKRVGLTGFNCRCGNLFCSVHRYSDKHNCPFDYRTAARDAIAKANPLVKAKKLNKI